jgi:SAM-dependent methyltransferase
LRAIVLYYTYGYRIGEFGGRLPDRGLRAAAFRLCAWLLQRLVAPSLGPGPLPYAQPGGRVLDVGCGNAAWLLQMQALGWQAEGVEVSAQACAAARQAGLTVYEGSLADAAFPDAQYDMVRIWHALEHIPEPAGFLHEVARILKPGGQLLIGVPNAGGWLARLWGTYWFDLDAPRHLWHLAAPELRRLAEQAGLRVVAVATQPSGDYALLWSLRYYAEELGLRCPDDRRGFDAMRRWLHTARSAAAARMLLGILERGNALVLLATRPGQRS